MSIKAYSSYTVVDVVDGLQWQGSFVSAPENPKLGWAYYNIIDKTSYMYDGTNWVPFAYDGEKGNGISKTEMQYCQSDSNQTQPTDGWVDSFPEYDSEKPYVWTRIKETWTEIDTNGVQMIEYHSYKVMSQLDCITEWAAKDGKDLGQWCYDNDCSVMEGGAIASGTITADQIAANAITSDHIESQAITADHIEAEAIISGHITANAITADKIAVNAITAEKIQAGAVTADKIKVDGTLEVSDNASISGWSLSSNSISKENVGMTTDSTTKVPKSQLTLDQSSADPNTSTDLTVSAGDLGFPRFYAGTPDSNGFYDFTVTSNGAVIAKKIYVYNENEKFIEISSSNPISKYLKLSEDALTRIAQKIAAETTFVSAVANELKTQFTANPTITFENK